MTAFYLLVENEDELRDLSHGHTSPQIREMSKTLLEWHEADLANAAKPAAVVKKPRRPKLKETA